MEKDNITTEKHFEIFTKEVCRLVSVFGLKHKELYFDHCDLLTEDPNARTLACFEMGDGDVSWVRFTLGKNWGKQKITKHQLNATALHEVYHYLLSALNQLCRSRFITEDQIAQEEHHIVSRLMNVTFGNI